MWLTVAWLATVVWLPVATALTGASPDTDTVVKGLYIGSLTAVVLMLALQRGWLLRHPDLRETDDVTVARGLSFDLSMLLLYVLALVVVLIFPMTSYLPLFLMVLVAPVQRVLGRFVERRHAPTPDAPTPDGPVPDTPAQDESSAP